MERERERERESELNLPVETGDFLYSYVSTFARG